MEQNECECPCECSLDPGMCEGEDYELPSNQPCPHTAEPTLHFPESVLTVLPSLNTCHHFDCDKLTTHKSVALTAFALLFYIESNQIHIIVTEQHNTIGLQAQIMSVSLHINYLNEDL